MNFLEICKRVRQESGISGTGPVTVVSQTGEFEKIVGWVLSAYQDVQNRHANWNFMRFDFSFPTIAATSTYLPSAVSLAEHAKWELRDMRTYLAATGVSDENRLTYIPWSKLKAHRLIGVVQSGKPVEFAVRPDKSLVFWPTPDAVYTTTGEYWKRAQTMAANADEPLIPDEFHMIIVWGAVRYYAGDQGAAELFALADANYTRMMRALEIDQLPAVEMAGALA